MTLHDIYAPVRAELSRVEEVLAEELAVHAPRVRELLEHVTSYRGKRMRPALALLTAKCLGRLGEGHIFLATIVELIHTATLVHDDILDEAQMRRGIPTVSAKWGTEISVLLGDYLFSRAFSVLARFDGAACLGQLTRTTNMMCEGELVQLRSRYDLDLDESLYLHIAELKTAALCGVSARLGARLAGAPAEVEESFYQFGLKLGTAFQITDDCLDITGTENVVGKSLGTDLTQGKLTLPAIRLLQRLSPSERAEVAQMVQQGFPAPQRARFQELARKHASVESSLETARQLLLEGRAHLRNVPESAAKRSLYCLCDYILAREL